MKNNKLDVFLHKWVYDAINDYDTDFFVATGGYGSAKSFSSWQWLYQKLRENPDCKRAFYTEPVYHLIKSVCINTFEAFADSIKLVEGKHFDINRSAPQTINLYNGKVKQEILLRSCQNPDVLVGFNSGYGVMDEAALCKEEAFFRLVARNRFQFKNKPQMMLPTTPEGINWFAENFDSDVLPHWKQLDKRVAKLIENIDGDVVITKRIRIETADNQKFLPAGYIANIKKTYGHNLNYLKSYLYGIFAPFSEGLAVENYNPKIHDLREHEKANPDDILFLTWDWNAKPLSWLAVSGKTKQGETEYKVHEESELGYSQIEDACIEFSIKCPVKEYQYTEIQIDGDPSGFNDSHKTRYNDFERVKKQLELLGFKNVHIQATASKMAEIDTLDALNKVFFENRCFVNFDLKDLKRSFSMTQLKENQRKIDKPAGENWSHKVDALKYLICRLESEGINRNKNKLRGFKI